LRNPIDVPPMLSSDALYRDLLRRILSWEGVDLVLFQVPLRGIVLTLPVAQAIFDAQIDNILTVRDECRKPLAVIMHYLATGEGWQAASAYHQRFATAGLPVYLSTLGAMKAIDRHMRCQESRKNA
jgi:hypothetical protein